jgi:hypothetical protein
VVSVLVYKVVGNKSDFVWWWWCMNGKNLGENAGCKFLLEENKAK